MESENRISRFLDCIGFVPEEIRWRRQVWRDFNKVLNIERTISGIGLMYITGSRPEGVGVKALASDTDIMFRAQHALVIHTSKDWEQRRGVRMLLADTKGVHPGYCKLLVMYTDVPIVMEVQNHIHKTLYVNHNHMCFKTTKVDSVRNGPAETMLHTVFNIDAVGCIPTTFSPWAIEWLERNRPGQFPSTDFIHESSRRDAFVVPTGYKKREHQDFEWRFSFSLIELDIVLMWPDKVTRCYVLLNMLLKHISSVSPHLSGIISSYHVKTVLFWLTEETGVSLWNSSSLGKCLMFSLIRLLFLIEQGYIPHYFVKDNNLFDLHIGTARQRDVAAALRAMISDGPACVFRCDYYKKLSVGMELKSITYKSNYVRYKRMLLHVRCERMLLHLIISSTIINFCDIKFSYDTNESITSLCKALDIVRGAISNYDNATDSDVAKSLDWVRANLQCMLATSILSTLLQHSVSNTSSKCLFKLSEQLLKTSGHQHVGLLKIANFYYQTKQYELATNVLRILSWMEQCRPVMISYSLDLTYSINIDHIFNLAERVSPAEFLSNRLSMSLIFELPEIHVAPYALKFEIFQPKFGLAGEEKDEPDHSTRCLVYPAVFVYYLSYLCYESMGRREKAHEAFDKLQSVAKQDNQMHQATTWNIVGHCYFKHGKLRQAVNCLVKSVKIQPVRSVALLHLALVIQKAFAENNASPV